MKKISCLLVVTLLAACAPSSPHGVDLFDLPAEKREEISRNLDAVLAQNLESLEQGLRESPARAARTPWHLEYFSTDLAVTVSGFLGLLSTKGTPGLTVFWRKQHPAGVGSEDGDAGTVLIAADTTREELDRELEPAIRAALATGRIQDESAFRDNLRQAAEDFRGIGAALERSRGGQWWLSRYRLDLTVDATGKVSPVVTAGVEVRIRFEWHRIMKKPPPERELAREEEPGVPGLSRALVAFADTLAEDLEELSDPPGGGDFKAYQYRVGLGVSYKGTVGIAKVTTSALGHLYFSRDVKKPVVHPAPSGRPRMETLDAIQVVDVPAPSLARLSLSASEEPQAGELAFKIKREDFRIGLKKALKMGQFFGLSAEKASRSAKGSWKVYELRTSFDLALSGKTALTSVQGLGSTEINFYNEGF